jgi:hypothetical protein
VRARRQCPALNCATNCTSAEPSRSFLAAATGSNQYASVSLYKRGRRIKCAFNRAFRNALRSASSNYLAFVSLPTSLVWWINESGDPNQAEQFASKIETKDNLRIGPSEQLDQAGICMGRNIGNHLSTGIIAAVNNASTIGPRVPLSSMEFLPVPELARRRGQDRRTQIGFVLQT